MRFLNLPAKNTLPSTRDGPGLPAPALPTPKSIKVHPTHAISETDKASLYFVGTATTILEYGNIRIMTDPNFLHNADHTHLGPGVQATRKTNPALELDELPSIDLILLSHYHADHFDQIVENRLRRDIPIVSTPHAKEHLEAKGEESFTKITALEFWESVLVSKGPEEQGHRRKDVKITGMPGKHVPDGVLGALNKLVGAIPPTNGWMVELGHTGPAGGFESGYRIYISGDTLLVSELSEIPKRYAHKPIDLMLVHLGGTTIPGPHLPLLMVTMDGEQGLGLMQLIKPDITIPIHYDDYDVFLSPLNDFKQKVKEAGFEGKVVYLDRKDQYHFNVKPPWI